MARSITALGHGWTPALQRRLARRANPDPTGKPASENTTCRGSTPRRNDCQDKLESWLAGDYHGHNKTKQHPILLKKYKLYSTHAECDVILKSKNEGNILIVVRVRRQDGKFTMAKPCKKCMSFIKDSGIKKIWFTNWNGELEFLKV